MKNRLAVFAMFILVSSVIVGAIPDAKAATEAETLLRLANQAKNEVQQQLRSMDEVPADVKRLFDQGSNEVDLLKTSIEKENSAEIRKHFLSAMEIFKKITQSTMSKQERVQTPVAQAPRPDLISDLDRLAKYMASLKSIAKKHGVEIDFVKLDEMFALAKRSISQGDYDTADQTIEGIKRLIIDINKVLREDAAQKQADRAKTFAQQYLNLLDRLISEMEDQGYSAEIIAKLNEAKERLAKSSDPEEIIQEVRQILSLKEQFDITKVDRIKDRLNQLEQSIKKLSANEKTDKTSLNEALQLLEKLKNQLKDNKHDQAQDTLKQLTDLVRDLEKSVRSS